LDGFHILQLFPPPLERTIHLLIEADKSHATDTALQAGLSLDPPLGYHPIHIIVKDGRLKLLGVVQNIADKTIAGLVAGTLENVFEVENGLAVANEMTPIRRGKKDRARM